MGTIDDFVSLLESTDVMKQVLKNLKEEPAHLLGNICREYQRTGQPVPDHRLPFVGYLGDAAVKALISAGLIKRQSGGLTSLYSYEPTPEGLGQYKKLKADGFYEK
jgi:hypothetical protein